MSDKTEKPLFTGPAVSLLRAVGVGADFAGSAGVIKTFAECITAATAIWPTDAFVKWKLIADEMTRTLTAVKSQTTQTTFRLFLTLETLPEIQRQFLAYRAPSPGDRQGNEVHALIGKALVIAATTQQLLPTEFFKGIKTLQLARNEKGRRSPDWNHFSKVDLTNSQEVLAISQCLSVKSPASGFAKFSAAVLNALVIAPVFRGDPKALASERISQIMAGKYKELPVQSTELNALSMSTSDEDQDNRPDIATRFASAEYTGFSEKLGLPSRDHLLVSDLEFVTRKFQALMKDGTPEERGFVVLATLSLVSGWSGKVALKLGFSHGDNNWLDLKKGAWAWDFDVYKKSKGPSSTSETSEPIYCPWPSFVDQPLTHALGATPDAKTLKDLIQAIQGTDQVDLKKYKAFLQSCGHPAHPAYSARFARSLQAVYLELTSSDMTAALMTGFFAAVAPAALFYYGPDYCTLIDRVAAVYERLKLGSPSNLLILTGRAGCQKLLETDNLQAGWARLHQEINTVQQMANSSTSDDHRRRHCNRWMALIGTGFIIQTAHRATRLECLTVGALYVSHDVVLINDKDEGGRAQPRLVPKTHAVRQLLLSATQCRQIMESELTSKVQTHSLLNHDALVFVQWSSNGATDTESSLCTATVSEITQEFFGATANFGRSQWVTYLDQAGCDRWLIRSLTGHTRDVTRTNGPYLDIPPLTMAARLCDQMERIGLEIFGQTAINTPARCQLKIALPKFKPGMTKSVTDGPVPDPDTILAPLSVCTIAEWSAVERIRRDLYAGRIEAPVFALAFLHLAFIDHIPVSQVCLDAVSGLEGSVKMYCQRKGIQWNRPHFVHPTWFPVHSSMILSLSLHVPIRKLPAGMSAMASVRVPQVCSSNKASRVRVSRVT